MEKCHQPTADEKETWERRKAEYDYLVEQRKDYSVEERGWDRELDKT